MTSMPHSDLILDIPERLCLAQTPTPIQHLPRLSKLLGAQIYCKRDDLTGFGFGGNKIRKLEYLLSDAMQLGSDCLVTCGSNQSNWCCMASVAGAVLGMDVYLVLGGPVPLVDTGNIRLARIAGARISHLNTTDDAALESATRGLESTLHARGRRPYRMIMGGSTGLGAFGYAHALFETMEFEQAKGIAFSKIIHATGSAGTQAGLIVGSLLRNWPGDIIGMAVSRSAGEQTAKVRGVLSQVLNDAALARARILVDDAFVGGGYRQRTDACAEAIDLFLYGDRKSVV